jgi:Nucleotidyl transferase AbiEii toxin, Type IV TA system
LTDEAREYKTAGAFRVALEARLPSRAHDERTDLQRLRRQVAFDRLLGGLFPKRSEAKYPWILKGGDAMELRIRAARTTKDIDLTLYDGSRLSKDPGERRNQVRAMLQGSASIEFKDYFEFLIGRASENLDGALEGGSRYPVEARMDGREFARFHVDVGIGDEVLEPVDVVEGRDWLRFGGITPPSVPVISREQQFAEKLHAYSLPRGERVTRTKDLIGMLLMIEQGNLDNRRVASAIATTFEKRATHDVPRKLEPPPAEWKPPLRRWPGNVVSRRICRTALRRCKGSSPGLANDDDRKRHDAKPQGTEMRLNRGDRIAGVDGLQLRRYFQRFGSEQVNYATVMDELSVTKRQAEKLLTELLKLEMISRCEFQHDKKMVSYQTTIRGNALGMAKAGKPVTRASAEEVLRKFLDRVRVVNGRQELAHSVESVVVFGSYLSDAKRLNDLDIAVELRAKWHDDASFQNYRNASLDRARARGRRFRNMVEEVCWPQLEVVSILKNRSRTISFCEWNSLLRMEGLRYCVVFGNRRRVAGLLKSGRCVEWTEQH